MFKAIRENPSKLRCSYILGDIQNIGASILQEEHGLDFKPVTYDNGNAMVTSLSGKHIDFMTGNSSAYISTIGKAKSSLILGEKKSGLLPDDSNFGEVFKDEGIAFPTLSIRTFIAVHSDLKEKYPDRHQKILENYEKTLKDTEYQKFLKESKEAPIKQYLGLNESVKANQAIHELMEKYKDSLTVKY